MCLNTFNTVFLEPETLASINLAFFSFNETKRLIHSNESLPASIMPFKKNLIHCS